MADTDGQRRDARIRVATPIDVDEIADAALTAYASPRRLGAHIGAVLAQAADQAVGDPEMLGGHLVLR